jgi:TonB family protein
MLSSSSGTNRFPGRHSKILFGLGLSLLLHGLLFVSLPEKERIFSFRAASSQGANADEIKSVSPTSRPLLSVRTIYSNLKKLVAAKNKAAASRFSAAAISGFNKVIRQTITYPQLAQYMGWTGKVRLKARIYNNGTATAQVVQSSGHKVLDDAAVAAVENWKFPEAMSGQSAPGSSSPEEVFFSFVFSLN